ncbi:MAG: SAM-dependent chlorinase/fluorinase [Elusimicrobia bacterium]|nr:SAM-dependent chlorinase/fluorinase [Elusimicrobiota bacterium]
MKILRRWACLAVVSGLLFSVQPVRAAPPQTRRTIGFLSDFDLKDDAVGICKAVMEGVAPGVKVIDITHQVTPFAIAEGARFLAGAAPYFPRDAVFVAVVDPGVGGSRKAVIARSKAGQFFVLPDNGLLTLIQDRDGIAAAREIANPDWMAGAKRSSTFHGRDIFSPAAAHLARGDDWALAGPELDVARLARLQIEPARADAKGLHGRVIGTDGPYGNLVLDVPAETFAQLDYRLGDTVPVTLAEKSYRFPFVKTFGDVPEGQGLFYIDSHGRLGLGLNKKDFAKTYSVGPGAGLFIPRRQ